MPLTINFNGNTLQTIPYQRATQTIPFISQEAVPDKQCGYLVYQNAQWDYRIRPTYTRPIQNLALILESPHKDEYNFQNQMLYPIGPACGKTGKNIQNHLQDVFGPFNGKYIGKNGSFNSLNSLFDYRVHWVNPVQYQTSCYHRLSMNKMDPALKQKVFRVLYKVLRFNFYQRLMQINPQYILNACTAKLKPTIQPEISAYIQANSSVPVTSCHHPCTWN